MRARLKASATADININHLVTFCAIRALAEVPSLNAEFIDGRIQEHTAVHLGFACDTPKGLLVPVVRNAHRLPLPALAARMRELTDRTVAGTIAVDDLTGATFTISNLGNLGIESFTPLLNPPQVAILGGQVVDAGAELLTPLREEVWARSRNLLGREVPLLEQQVADKSGIVSAAGLVMAPRG